jgi:modulator of drug activity B
VKAEVQNFLWADVVIWQMPGWWMGAPWTVKNTWTTCSPKVTVRCMPAMAAPALTRPKIRFRRPDSGQKIYALADLERPLEAFTDKDQFFEGVGVDGAYLPFHKANQFLGMDPLPTFIVNDVIKMPDVPSYIAEYRKHLAKIFA